MRLVSGSARLLSLPSASELLSCRPHWRHAPSSPAIHDAITLWIFAWEIKRDFCWNSFNFVHINVGIANAIPTFMWKNAQKWFRAGTQQVKLASNRAALSSHWLLGSKTQHRPNLHLCVFWLQAKVVFYGCHKRGRKLKRQSHPPPPSLCQSPENTIYLLAPQGKKGC